MNLRITLCTLLVAIFYASSVSAATATGNKEKKLLRSRVVGLSEGKSRRRNLRQVEGVTIDRDETIGRNRIDKSSNSNDGVASGHYTGRKLKRRKARVHTVSQVEWI
jgi:hypothetical protein